jgi:serine/threonine-protein kinase ULK/ATG1
MASPRPAPSSKRQPARITHTDRPPDEIIGDFVRKNEIGKGSFAHVYLAQHRKKKSYAAIKAIERRKLSPKLLRNLDTEIKVLTDIHHPHVVALFMTDSSPEYFYMVMEYCQLSDLSQFLKKRDQAAELPETRDIFRRYPNSTYGGFHEVLCRHFIKQLSSAMSYLIEHGMMHRDIKPQNLLLNPPPTYMSKQRPEDLPLEASEHSLTNGVGLQSLPMLKLADFGFARYLPASTMAETLCGSPLYMAPEILRYERYDQKADLWSAGAVLFEMMYGKAPFRASNHVDLLRKIEQANNKIDFNSKVPLSSQMKDLIRKLLNKNPLERITYEGLAEHIVVSGEIPNLVPEDKEMVWPKDPPEPASSVRRSLESSSRPMSEPGIRQKPSQEETAYASRKSSDQESKPRSEDMVRHKSSIGSQKQSEDVGVEMQRRPSQREQGKQRRPSITAHQHQTAPGRQELQTGTGPVPSSAPRMERRPSRTSPLTNPPMVREPSTADPERLKQDTALREARERTAQDMAFEKEYVMVEKRAVEINAFADEMDANRNMVQGALARRYTTQGRPAPAPGVEPPSPSRALQVVAGRPLGTHQRAGSFERRYAPSPQSATNMLTKALNAANVRLFGALGTSPPFGKGPSPPRGYGAFPAYPTPQGQMLLSDGNESKTPVDEDTKIVRTMEDAGHRSGVIFGFAEVKYRQLLPATPSTQDALGIQQIGVQEKLTSSGGEEDQDMTTIATVTVAEEALVLYVKTLAILAKTIDLAGYWWNKQNRVEALPADPAARPPNSNSTEVGKRMNNVVQWARGHFNECLEKSEIVGRKLQQAQRKLPMDHPGHPSNHKSTSSTGSGAVTTSAEHIQITSGVTAEKLMFERAVEMSRAAAVSELVGEELRDCEISYVTAIMLLEAVLESDDEPLIRRPSAKKDKPGDALINGMETEDRQTVIKRASITSLSLVMRHEDADFVRGVIESARSRLHSIRKKILAAQEAAKRGPASQHASGNVTPRAGNNVSPALTPAVGGTPPK